MAGFLFAQLANTSVSTPTNTNLFTVPAGHSYVVKFGVAVTTIASSGQPAFHLELSDTAGANFRRISEDFTPPNAAGTYLVNLTPPNVELQNPSALVANASQTFQGASILNMPLKAGQILRAVSSGSFSSNSITFALNGIDDTE